MDLLDYLSVKDFNILNNYLDKRILYKKKDDANLRKIYLWLKHCDKLLESQNVVDYKSNNLNKLFV